MMEVIENERWRSVNYLPKSYGVSDHGRVRYMCDEGEYTEKSYFQQNGYKCVSIKGKVYAVHRMMADVFLPDVEGATRYAVVFSDGDPTHLTVDNLEKRPVNFNLQSNYDRSANTTRPKIYCKELNTVYSSIQSVGFVLGIPHELVSHSIQTGKPVCGFTFSSLEHDDPILKDKKLIHVSMKEMIEAGEKATSIKEFRSQLEQI